MRFKVWLVWRYIASGGKFLSWTSTLALFGMIIGVACLVISMAVVSGVQTMLKQSIVDVSGHILLMRPGAGIDDYPEVQQQIRKILPDVVALTPFVSTEAVLAHDGIIGGILIQGVEPETVEQVLNVRNRVIHGQFSFEKSEGVEPAMIGKVIAKKFALKVGDRFQLVMPKARPGTSSFSPKVETYFVSAILDLGKYEFNERYVIMNAKAAQSLADIGPVYTGVRIRILDQDLAREQSFRLSAQLGLPYWTKDWQEISYNFFSAVELEKRVIFVVLLFMVLVASFNISSVLFVNVLRRYSDISILKTIGMTKKFLIRLFVVQGLMIGMIGAGGGLLLGLAMSWLLAKATWLYIPAEIYKFDHLPVEFRIWDIVAILVATIFICFISTFAPARRGANLNAVEGLRYE